MEEADERGDVHTIYDGARALSGKSKKFQTKQSTINKQGDIIQSSAELGNLPIVVVPRGKFAATDLETMRKEYTPLETEQRVDTLSYGEFEVTVNRMKNRKTTGAEGVTAEVWKNSTLAKQELYFVLKNA